MSLRPGTTLLPGIRAWGTGPIDEIDQIDQIDERAYDPVSDDRRHRVLVTDGADGQSRSALAATRALGSAGCAVTVTTGDGWSVAGVSRYCDRQVRVPRFDADGYAAAVRAELASMSYLFALPASDGAMIALDDPAAHLVDKFRLAAHATAAGVQVLPTTLFDDGRQLLDADGLTFPMVVKPREKLATDVGIGEARRVDGRQALVTLASVVANPVVVQPFVDAPLDSIAGVIWKGRIVAIAHQRALRTWPVECGVSSAAETVEPDVDKEEPLRALLHGHDGIFQAQFLDDYLIDLNPRVYGSMPLATAAGANLPAILSECVLGRAPELVRARVGVRYRWLEGDLRNLWSRASRGLVCRRELYDGVRPRSRTAHSVESFLDPLPVTARLRFAIDRWRQ